MIVARTDNLLVHPIVVQHILPTIDLSLDFLWSLRPQLLCFRVHSGRVTRGVYRSLLVYDFTTRRFSIELSGEVESKRTTCRGSGVPSYDLTLSHDML